MLGFSVPWCLLLFCCLKLLRWFVRSLFYVIVFRAMVCKLVGDQHMLR